MNENWNKIRAVITDIDGVLTDGKVMLSGGAENYKRICFKDLDAVSLLRAKGIKLGIISGESDAFTDLLYERMHPDYFYTGCKDKKKALEEIAGQGKIELADICYIGDGKYDLEAIKAAGIGACPLDAIEEVAQAADVILKRNGGDGCLAEVFSLLSKSQDDMDGFEPDTVLFDLLEHKKVIEAIICDSEIQNAVHYIAEEISKSLQQGGQLLLCGNGGSAADAQHLATELVSRFYHERNAFNAEALSVNTSSLTAIGNDYSFDRVFARQVEAKGKAGDVLIGISTSGESANIIEAMKYANSIGMKTVAFTGIHDSTLKKLADISISVPSKDTPHIQEMHILVGHIICELVEKKLMNEGHGYENERI